jgi:hypothetical protein
VRVSTAEYREQLEQEDAQLGVGGALPHARLQRLQRGAGSPCREMFFGRLHA